MHGYDRTASVKLRRQLFVRDGGYVKRQNQDESNDAVFSPFGNNYFSATGWLLECMLAGWLGSFTFLQKSERTFKGCPSERSSRIYESPFW